MSREGLRFEEFDPFQCRNGFIHIDNLLVDRIEGCTVYNGANREDTRPNHKAAFNTTPFGETIDGVRTRTVIIERSYDKD